MLSEQEYERAERRLGIVSVVAAAALLVALFLVPARDGAAPSSKWYLATFLLCWLAWGFEKIRPSKARRKANRGKRKNAA